MTSRIPRKPAKQVKVGTMSDMRHRDWNVLAEFFGFRNGYELKMFAYQQASVKTPALRLSDE